MKNLLLILVLTTMVASSTFAQMKKQNKHRLEWKSLPRHDVRVGIGPEPLLPYTDNDWDCCVYPRSLEQKFNSNNKYLGRRVSIPSLMAEYTYRVGYRWEVGAVVSFHREGQKVYDIITDRELSNNVNFNVGFTPTVRFMWLSRKYVRLYSSAALGIGVQKDYEESKKAKVIFNGQFTYIGVAAGNRIFGFFDAISFGTQALGCKAGVGYRF